jgi:hypothetical protein
VCLLSTGDVMHAQAPSAGPRWECSLDEIDTTTVCASAPTGGEARYVTDIVMQDPSASSTVRVYIGKGISATTGEVCGNERAALVPTVATARFVATGPTLSATLIQPRTPYRVPPDFDLCFQPEVTVVVHVLGYLGQ